MPALDILEKALLPTHLSTAGIRERLAADIYERAILSARTTEIRYLETLQKLLSKVASGQINATTFRTEARGRLQELGYSPETGFPGQPGAVPPAVAGSLRDLGSVARLDLISKTEARKAASVARVAGEDDVSIFLFPAWRLTRFVEKVNERNWWPRWQAAGNAVAWEGASRREMVALKNSPIWKALGDRNRFPDALGNPFAPFAYGSGMDVEDVEAEEAKRLGLDVSQAGLPAASLRPSAEEWEDAGLSPDERRGA